MAISAQDRSQIGRLGAYSSWGNTRDRSARTAPARAARDRKFVEQAGGDLLRAEALRKAHFAKLAYKSVLARRKAAEAVHALAEAEAAAVELAEAAETET